MKINWGTGIVLAFVAFISFIMYFVIIMSTDSKYDRELVTEEYYKNELAFQDQMNKEQRAKNLGFTPIIIKNESGLVVSFPEKYNTAEISGTLFLYRPSNKKLDFVMPISVSSLNTIIPSQHLLDGRWNIEINWTYKGDEYFYKEELTY
jgi:hypothetical protein